MIRAPAFLSGLGRAYIGVVLLFLYLPLIIMAAMSFNASPFYQLPFEGTTEWYAALAKNDGLIAATLASRSANHWKVKLDTIRSTLFAGRSGASPSSTA